MNKLANIVIKNIKVIWVIGTILSLLCCLYVNWYLSISRSYNDISLVAKNISNHVDGFIEDLFQEAYTIPIYEKNISECTNSISPYLQHIINNNPKISGLIIKDNKSKIVCSTLPDNDSFITATIQPRSILGPFRLAMFEQPIYVFEQKIGNYQIGLLILSSELENMLQSSNSITNSIELYNIFQKKPFLRIEQDSEKHRWKISKNMDSLSPSNTQTMYAEEKLQSINGVDVVVFENHNTVLYNLWFSEGLFALGVLLLSFILYLLVRDLITKKYSLHNAMKLAIKRGEFYPVYQPIFDRIKEMYTGVEVLLRWQDNQDEIIMPDFFIKEAEITGLIVPITLQIIETSFQQTKAILDEDPEFHLAFNISALHFTDQNFFNNVYQLTEYYQISPMQIIFEVTERDLLDKNDDIFVTKMQELIHRGYSLAVDDYGTGHASISYLQHFPFNYLKIDQLFVKAIGTKAITESLIDTIIRLAKSLNLIIIAEGVETDEQFNYLSENDVRFLQGWYFSKALSIEHLIELLKEK